MIFPPRPSPKSSLAPRIELSETLKPTPQKVRPSQHQSPKAPGAGYQFLCDLWQPRHNGSHIRNSMFPHAPLCCSSLFPLLEGRDLKNSRLRVYRKPQHAPRQKARSQQRLRKRYVYHSPCLLVLHLFSNPGGQGLIANSSQFIINASQPASDKIFDVSAFEKFLHEKIKVDGRVGNLGDIVQISQQGEGKIEVVAHTQFSGRYLKYL